MPHRLYREVARRAGSRCEYCLAPEAVSPGEFEVDHVLPRGRGGGDLLENLALACGPCNRRKHLAVSAVDPESGGAVALFNPRREGWDEHFEFVVATGEIRGRTPVGRATVHRLALNRPHATRARLVWAVLSLYPPGSRR
jgi:hypothetical protein